MLKCVTLECSQMKGGEMVGYEVSRNVVGIKKLYEYHFFRGRERGNIFGSDDL